jgi:hypothetical protein
MGIKVANNVASLITNSLIPATITIQITPGTGSSFPALGVGDYFYATLISAGGAIEVVKVTAISGDVLTVLRGQDNTVALSFSAGSRIEMRINAALFNDVGALAANSLQTSGGTISNTLEFENNGFTPLAVKTSNTVQYTAAGVYLNTYNSSGNQATALLHTIDNPTDSSATSFQIQSRLNNFSYGASWYVINYKDNYQSFLVNNTEVLRLVDGGVLATSTGGLGYRVGSGGAVTQATSRTTGVTLDTPNGAITLVSAAGSTTFQSFTVINATVAATDTIIVNQKSGTDLYEIHVTAVSTGSFRITFRTTGGTTTEQPVFNFAVIKAVNS